MEYIITRDGKPVAETDRPTAWFHRNTAYSEHHAVTYEGYRVLALAETQRPVSAYAVYARETHRDRLVGYVRQGTPWGTLADGWVYCANKHGRCWISDDGQAFPSREAAACRLVLVFG